VVPLSWVTNLILILSIAEDEEARIEEVNRFFHRMPHAVTGELSEAPGLASVEPVWDNNYYPLETNVYVGAYNYFPLERFVEHLRSIAWEEPDFIQLFVQDQEELEFRVIKLGDDPMPPPRPA
jgi:hypothetical protein